MLWSAPRSRSTAFFRMVTQRGDFTAVHEPFSYLAEFGQLDIGGTRVTSVPGLLDALRLLAGHGPVFAKETTGRRYPGVLADRQFLASDCQHTFLIRHPRETIASYHGLSPGAPLHKIGFESQYEVFAAVARATGRTPVVLDSADLVSRPAAAVAAYCERVGIGFRPEALAWPAVDRPEWAKSRGWHAEVAASTGFSQARAEPGVDVTQHPVLRRYLGHHLPYYQKLYAHRLMV
ncbi:MAG: sulfotransferase family protein [Actinomycetota bacterium]